LNGNGNAEGGYGGLNVRAQKKRPAKNKKKEGGHGLYVDSDKRSNVQANMLD
jgi:hypothetical protein